MDRSNIKGKFIAFEGLDGCGKTTQARMLAGFLKTQGIKYTYVREPGGTSVGDQIRAILLNPATVLSPWGEVLLYAAARAQLVQDIILPCLDRGELVVSDRYIFSSLAYQGYGLQQDVKLVEAVNLEAVRGLMPTQTFLLQITPQEGLARQASSRGLDRIEQRSSDYFQRVVDGYGMLAQDYGFSLLDGTKDPGQIHQQVLESIKDIL